MNVLWVVAVFGKAKVFRQTPAATELGRSSTKEIRIMNQGFLAGLFSATVFIFVFAVSANAQDLRSEGSKTLTLGINRPNLVWFSGGDKGRQKQVLDSMHRAGARRVRLALQLPYEKALEHILDCNRLGMDVTIWIGAADPAFYSDGAIKREGIPNPEGQFPLLWDPYRLADLDIPRFRRVLGGFLRACRDRGARIQALQIFNEVNWAAY